MQFMVSCVDSNGSSAFFLCDVDTNEFSIDEGEAHEQACNLAADAGYGAPYLAFDEAEQNGIARVVQHLPCPVPVSLKNIRDDIDLTLTARLHFSERNLSISVDGHSDYYTTSGGCVVLLEHIGIEQAALYAWSDINLEDPTDIIYFDNAAESRRKLLA